ncbi:MAG: A24 family peptidase [Clostridia bacterium]|nr:A24 family peptidase [Clostridia bacterium]
MAGWILPVVTTVLCIISFIFLVRDLDENPKVAKYTDVDGKQRKTVTKSVFIYSILMTIITISISVLLSYLYKDNSIAKSLKSVALLSLLWPIAIVDYRSYRIPNIFIILGLVYRLIIFFFELIYQSDLVWMSLLSEVIAALALLVAALLCTLGLKNSIGYGDMKLFILMGFLLGLEGIWGAIFLSLIVSFFISAYLLITKRKTRKDAIPFGPAITIGTFLSICLTGM